MVSLLLPVIYLAFISLGLPDALLGSAWPVMQGALNAPLSFAGAVSMVISGGTILSSLLSDRMTRKLGAGLEKATASVSSKFSSLADASAPSANRQARPSFVAKSATNT